MEGRRRRNGLRGRPSVVGGNGSGRMTSSSTTVIPLQAKLERLAQAFAEAEQVWCVQSRSENVVDRRNIPSIGWSKPPTGLVKINVDGAIERSLSRGGAARVIRDEKGVWIMGGSDEFGLLHSSAGQSVGDVGRSSHWVESKLQTGCCGVRPISSAVNKGSLRYLSKPRGGEGTNWFSCE